MGTLSCRDATTYFAEDPISEDNIRVGEASFALDPLSSTGVEKAMHSGFIAGTAVHTVLVRPESVSLCANFYQSRQTEAVSLHDAWSREFYGEVQRFKEYPFWQKRASPRRQQSTQVVSPPRQETVTLTCASELRLSPRTSVADAACIVEDEICSRLAVSHPSLARPVAFLQGVELVPLLEVVPRISTIEGLVSLWSRWLSPGQAIQVARWLLNNQIIEPLSAFRQTELLIPIQAKGKHLGSRVESDRQGDS